MSKASRFPDYNRIPQKNKIIFRKKSQELGVVFTFQVYRDLPCELVLNVCHFYKHNILFCLPFPFCHEIAKNLFSTAIYLELLEGNMFCILVPFNNVHILYLYRAAFIELNNHNINKVQRLPHCFMVTNKQHILFNFDLQLGVKKGNQLQNRSRYISPCSLLLSLHSCLYLN